MNLFKKIKSLGDALKAHIRVGNICLAGGLAVLLLAPDARAAIAQRGTATTASITSGTSLTIGKPAGVVAGDVMIVCIAQYASSSGAATLSGWTSIKSGSLGGSTSRYGTILYKVAGASEPASYTFTLTPSVSGAVGDIVAFSGVDLVSPLDVAAASLPNFATASSTAVTATTINTVSANAAVIMFGMAATTASGTGGTWGSWASGLTQLFNHQGSGTVNGATSVGAAWKTMATAGATGGGTATLSTSMRNGGIWVALRPLTPPADAANSTVSAAPTSVMADGVNSSTITVTLKDSVNAAVVGRTVTLASSRGATDTISAASGVSSGSGVVTFTVNSTTPGASVFTATDTTESVVVTQTATVTFIASPNKDILTFGTDVIGSSAVINTAAATVVWTVPYGSAVGSLAPVYSVSSVAAGSPVSGTSRDFTTPQTYTITAQDGSTKVYTVTVTVAPASPAKDFLTFGANYSGSTAVINSNAGTVSWTLPAGWSLANLAPAYTLPLFAVGSPVSGAPRDFTTPQTYTITAQDGSSKNFTVTATVTAGAANYAISASTDLAQDFSPMNKSGHPVITGLNNYPNSAASKALPASALKAPWSSNPGTQTMLCSDCHDATSTNYVASAAQGPHGSAYQFMLRGPNWNNWPNVTAGNFNSSWCANCHAESSGGIHGRSEHNVECYRCHIIVPHGGKMSRLIADRDGTMPARYAYQNNTANVYVQAFTKTSGTYQKDACQASCTSEHGTGGSESW